MPTPSFASSISQPFSYSATQRVVHCSVWLACTLAGTALAQTDASTQAVWRATSRLGYGPSAATMQAAQSNAKAWASQQIDLAQTASQRSPSLPAELAGINAPINTLVQSFHAEREARKTLREQRATPVAAGADPSVIAANDPERFSRSMQQEAAAWRVMSCSDPALENPLLARMTEFWFNHLNVFVGKGPVRPFVGHYALNVIRANALGKFEDLLLASAKHPAMLLYLDQAQSNNRGLNENYARELMELHTLGVNGGYTQNDVHALARILTGWTVPIAQGEGFRFAPRLHDTGSKTLMGVQYDNHGISEGEDAIRFLARHPATAQRISTRLARFFVADTPPPALVERLVKTYMATQGDIRALLHTLVDAPEFWAADNQLFKTPLDFACSALTAAGGARERRDIVQTLGFLAQAGQPMHGWQTPDGYKTDAATWLAPEALTRRADFAIALGQRIAEPTYLNAFLSEPTRARLAQEALPLRTGLLLASPDFMRK